jgi:hypothetical protein
MVESSKSLTNFVKKVLALSNLPRGVRYILKSTKQLKRI